jgi:hypothetical protein
MSNLVEKFIENVRMAEQLSDSKRPLAIRQKITEYEEIIVQNGGGCEEIWSVFGQAKDRAFQAITDHSTTPTADFYQEVFNELSLRCRTSIQELKNGTFQVLVHLRTHALPHVAKGDFPSRKLAQEWRDSDVGSEIIEAIIARETQSGVPYAD